VGTLFTFGLTVFLSVRLVRELLRPTVIRWDNQDRLVLGIAALFWGLLVFASIASVLEVVLRLERRVPRLGWQALTYGAASVVVALLLFPPWHDRIVERELQQACTSKSSCVWACSSYRINFPNGPHRAEADDNEFACARGSVLELARYARLSGTRHATEANDAFKSVVWRARQAYEVHIFDKPPANDAQRAGREAMRSLLASLEQSGNATLFVSFKHSVDFEGRGGHVSSRSLRQQFPNHTFADPDFLLAESGLLLLERSTLDELNVLTQPLLPAEPGHASGLEIRVLPEGAEPGWPRLDIQYELWPGSALTRQQVPMAYYGLAIDWKVQLHTDAKSNAAPAWETSLTSRAAVMPELLPWPVPDPYFELEQQALRDLRHQLTALWDVPTDSNSNNASSSTTETASANANDGPAPDAALAPAPVPATTSTSTSTSSAPTIAPALESTSTSTSTSSAH
jgi:hypothetical protein